MLEKMTSSQRLILAFALSFVFFMAYTAIFPPKPMNAEQNATVQTDALTNTVVSKTTEGTSSSVDLGHDTSATTVTTSTDVVLTTLTGHNYVLKIDTLGRIDQKEMLEEKFADEDTGNAKLVSETGAKPLYIRFADKELNKEAISTPYTSNVKEASLVDGTVSVTLTQKLSQLTVVKELKFYSDGHYDVNIKLSQDKRYYVYLGMHPTFSDKQMMAVEGVMVDTGEHLITIIEDGDADAMTSYNDVNLVSSFSQYFASIFYGLDKDTTVKVDRDRDDNPVVFVEGLQDFTFNGYIGPKDYKILHAIKPELINAIEYGWFTFAAAPLFQLLMFLHDLVGNWGWAIVLLTIIIRVVLFPLTFKGMISMAKLKEVSPKVKELQAKHKGDPQRMNAAVMALYKKEGANPLGGCLPLLMQIPVFFAIYRVLLNAVELKGAEWMLWITDLAHMDPTFVLPILMGASMYYQQRITPSNFTDPMQEKIFRFLPIIFTFFFVTFPAGLVLYWLVNNIFSIVQQFVVNNRFQAMKKAKEV
ncbi:membrane protein insertase YidC [Campylobacterota bacterium]